MDKFIVPQFIENEDKILGPITVRQFVMIVVTAILLFVVYKITDLFLFIASAIPILGIMGVLAFLKINGRPFHFFLLNIIQTIKKPSLRVWRKDPDKSAIITAFSKAKKAKKEDEEGPKDILKEPPEPKMPTKSRLSELSLVVDTGGAYEGKEEKPQKPI